MTSDIRNNDHSDKIRAALNNTSHPQRLIESSERGNSK